jgi:signal transduction histidine kinase
VLTHFLDDVTPRTSEDTLGRAMRLQGRIARHTAVAAIALLCVAWMFGRWPALAAMLASVGTVLVIDRRIGRPLTRRYGQHARIARTFAIHGVLATVGVLCGGPPPLWLAMPYTALVYEDTSRRRGWCVIGMSSAIYLTAALLAGLPLLVPVTFAVVSLAWRMIVDVRAAVMRSIVASLESQRDELAAAHSELNQIHEQLAEQTEARERVESELRHAQKLEAVGRLAAGIAHEINTPMQFIGNSLEFLAEGTSELLALARETSPADDSDLGYLADHIPSAIVQALEGVQRVKTIVRSMHHFVHPGGNVISPVDVNTTILNAITLCTHEYNLVADLVTDLVPSPPVRINPGELTQVVVNIIVNAAHAIAGVARGRGTIRIRSVVEDQAVAVFIEDSGGGIPDSIHSKIFDPFFTTKQVGAGTGQGLAIARGIVERAGGALGFDSRTGVGTTFCIRLPANAPEARRAA